MSFCTVDQVKAMFRNFESGSNAAVTDPEITEFIEEADGTINSYLTGVYVLPIVGAESLIVLRQISKWLAAYQVDSILHSYGEDDKKPTWQIDAMKMLYDISGKTKDGKRIEPVAKLPDAEYLGTNPTGSTLKLQATTGQQFKKGTDTW